MADYIQMRVGYGSVNRIKEKKAAAFVCSHPIGKKLIAQWICNKLINPSRIEQFNSRLVPKITLQMCQPGTLSFQNHWLAGFIQGDGSFQIKLLSRKNRVKQEVRIILQIDLKDCNILKQL